MATFGHTTEETRTSASDSDKIIGSGPFTLPLDGDISKITAPLYLGTSSKDFQANIYADSGGQADGSPLGATQAGTVGTSKTNVDFVYGTALSLTAGNYWLFIFQDAGGGTLSYYRKETAIATFAYQVGLTYPNWPDPIAESYQNALMTIWATYTPSAPTPTVKKKVMGHRVKLPTRVRERHFRHQYY